MAARKPLRAVGADEKAAPAKPKTISEAVTTGTTRDVLVASRDRIARALDDPNIAARDLASNSKRLMELIREIEALDARALEEDDTGASVEDGAFDASAV